MKIQGEIVMFKAIDIHTHFNHGSKYDMVSSEIYLVGLEDIIRVGDCGYILC